MPFAAACTAPNPHGKRHADKRRSHAPGKGTRRRTRAAQLHARARSASCAPARGGRLWDRATPPSPATASTEPRTFEVERLERRVLLERRRQSSRAVVADVIACGVHSTHPTRRASRRQEEEPRARQGDPTPHARRPAARASSLCIVRPRAAAARGTAPHPHLPSHREHRAAHLRGRASRASCSSRATPPELSRRRRRCHCLRRAQHPSHTASVTPTRGGATRPARGPDAARAPPSCTRELALHHVPARAAAARGTAQHPPDPATANTEPRTSEVERHERRVLLERGRKSSRAVVADVIVCGVHSTHPTRQASHRQEEEPRARQGDPTPHARRPAQSSLCIVRPRAAAARGTAPHPPLPQPPRTQSRAHPRSSVSSVVFFSSDAARALAPTSPMPLPAACTAPNPHGKRHTDKKEEPRARHGDPTP
jgi:ribosomal protein L14